MFSFGRYYASEVSIACTICRLQKKRWITQRLTSETNTRVSSPWYHVHICRHTRMYCCMYVLSVPVCRSCVFCFVVGNLYVYLLLLRCLSPFLLRFCVTASLDLIVLLPACLYFKLPVSWIPPVASPASPTTCSTSGTSNLGTCKFI